MHRLAGVIALVVASASAQAVDTANAQAMQLSEARLALALAQAGPVLSKELTVGCVAVPLPTVPTGPTWSFTIRSAGETAQATFWRQPCATAGDAQLLLTLTPTTGSPFICSAEATIIQNGLQTDDIFFDTNPNDGQLAGFCNDLFVPTTVVLNEFDNTFVFDDDAAFSFVYEQPSPEPDITVSVAAYDPAQYGQLGGGPLLLAGRLSGAYFDPARNGEGLFVEIGRVAARRTIFLSWFTYFQGQQRWIVGTADLLPGATSITVPMFVTSGAQFGLGFNPNQVVVTPWGSTTVSFPTCTTLRFQWSETGGQTGIYNYRRQVDGLEGITCP